MDHCVWHTFTFKPTMYGTLQFMFMFILHKHTISIWTKLYYINVNPQLANYCLRIYSSIIACIAFTIIIVTHTDLRSACVEMLVVSLVLYAPGPVNKHVNCKILHTFIIIIIKPNFVFTLVLSNAIQFNLQDMVIHVHVSDSESSSC